MTRMRSRSGPGIVRDRKSLLFGLFSVAFQGGRHGRKVSFLPIRSPCDEASFPQLARHIGHPRSAAFCRCNGPLD